MKIFGTLCMVVVLSTSPTLAVELPTKANQNVGQFAQEVQNDKLPSQVPAESSLENQQKDDFEGFFKVLDEIFTKSPSLDSLPVLKEEQKVQFASIADCIKDVMSKKRPGVKYHGKYKSHEEQAYHFCKRFMAPMSLATVTTEVNNVECRLTPAEINEYQYVKKTPSEKAEIARQKEYDRCAKAHGPICCKHLQRKWN